VSATTGVNKHKDYYAKSGSGTGNNFTATTANVGIDQSNQSDYTTPSYSNPVFNCTLSVKFNSETDTFILQSWITQIDVQLFTKYTNSYSSSSDCTGNFILNYTGSPTSYGANKSVTFKKNVWWASIARFERVDLGFESYHPGEVFKWTDVNTIWAGCYIDASKYYAGNTYYVAQTLLRVWYNPVPKSLFFYKY